MKKRSGAYPSKPIQDAESFAVSIFEKVGDTFLKDKDLAKHGNVAVRETDRFAVSAGQYGFMNQAYGKGYAPNSEICKALRTPKDGEKQQLYLNAFTSPQLYKAIANEFNGKKVTEEGLKIYLIRDHEFIDSGATLASNVFLENARFLGLIDSEGNFNINADIKIDPTVKKQKRIKLNGTTQDKNAAAGKLKFKQEDQWRQSTDSSTPSVNSHKKIPIFIRGQEFHWAVLPDMSRSDWDVVIKQLDNIKSFSR